MVISVKNSSGIKHQVYNKYMTMLTPWLKQINAQRNDQPMTSVGDFA